MIGPFTVIVVITAGVVVAIAGLLWYWTRR